MGAVAIQQMADRVAQLLEEKHSLRGRDLSAKLRRSGGVLPRKVRDKAELLATAAAKARNPKLLGQIDMGQVADAYDTCVRHLMPIDPAKRRGRVLSDIVGSIGFGILFLILAIIAFLAWRDYF